MGVGRRNVVFGFLWLLLFLRIGSTMEVLRMMGYELPELLVVAHGHTGIFAVSNVLIGLVIARTGLSEGRQQAASWLAIAAAVLTLLGGLLALVVQNEKLAAVSMLGGLCMIAAAGIIFVGLLSAPAEAE